MRCTLPLIATVLGACATAATPGDGVSGTYGYVSVLGGEELHLLPDGRYLKCEYADVPFADTGDFVRSRAGTYQVIGSVYVSDESIDDPTARRYFVGAGATRLLVDEAAYDRWRAGNDLAPNACCGRRPLTVDSAAPECRAVPRSGDSG